MKKNNQVKGYFGVAAKLIVAVTVFTFLAVLSWQFFTFIFAASRWYYAFLGFGLTGGGAIMYFVVIKSGDADTPIRKVVALSMLIICTIGELLTAGFGIQVEGLVRTGATALESATDFMVLAIQILAFCHAIALFVYYLFDDVRVWFADDNHNGIPDGFERGRNRPHNIPQAVGLNQDVPIVELSDNGKRPVNPQ